jgi:hypothetical protein
MDIFGQTALHVAAASLNFPAISNISRKSPTAVRTLDYDGNAPLKLLLRSISMRNWRKWIESHHLQKAIKFLVPTSNPALIWESGTITELTALQQSVRYGNPNLAAAKESLFYCAVVYTDDFILETVVQLARAVPVAQWDVNAAREALCKCAARPCGRKTSVDILFREIISPLINSGRICNDELLDIVDCCLCSAVLALKQTKVDRSVLKSLLERLVDLLQRPHLPTSTSIDYSKPIEKEADLRELVFVYIAALCGDADLLSFVLAALPRSLVRCLVYPTHAQHRPSPVTSAELANPFGENFVRKLRRFCNTLIPEVVHATFQSSFSPLCMMCALNRPDIVSMLLRACYSVPAHADSPAGREAARLAELDHFHPLSWAVHSGASECVRLVQNTLSKKSLCNMYFCMTGKKSYSFRLMICHIFEGSFFVL